MKQFLHKFNTLRLVTLLAVLVGSVNAVWGESVKYSVASPTSVTKSQGTAPDGSSVTFVNTYTTTATQITKGNSQTLTLKGYNGCTISNITLSMKSNASSGAGKLSYSIDGGSTFTYLVGSAGGGTGFSQAAWHGSWSTSWVDVSKSVNLTATSSDIIIKIECTTNSLHCQSFTITYTPAATTHTLTYSATNGSIAGVDAGSNAVASGADVAESAEVTLTATPADGYAFSSWEVSGTGSTLTSTSTNPTTFTMGTANATVTANFVAAGDYITASPTSADIASAGDVAEFTLTTNIVSPSYAVAYYTTSAGDETTTKPSWLGDVEFSSNTLDIEVVANSGAPRTAYLKVYSGTTYSSVITINQAGKAYTISVDDEVTGGSIEADLTEAVVGATVTLTATPDAAYTFGSWAVYEDDMTTEVTVTDNKFTMPACEVYVTATFNAKPTYAVTCAYNDAQGLLSASPTSAYEGQTVTLSYLPETGYSLSSIVITKTSDGTATGITPVASGDDYTFTMPGYAVTATATFELNTYDGTFALYSGDLTEGDYILVYDGNALKNTVSNNKFGVESVTPSNNMISNPLRSIVWHIAPSETDGYWTIYNAKAELYANGTSDKTNVSLGDDPAANTAIWSVNGTYDFRCKANEGQSTARYLRYYEDSDVFGNYAASNGGALTLYKLTVLTPRTITFDGNGGTYDEESTYTQDVYDGVEATLDANQFSLDGYAFAAWNTEIDGSGDEYDDEDAITVSGSDLTLYAQWAPLYTLTIDNSIEGGSVAVDGDITSAVAGTEITLTYSAASGHAFSAWDVYKAGEPLTKVTVTDDKFTMPSYNVVISATFEEVQTYALLTDAGQLVSGKHYIIASGTNGSVKAMGSQNTNNRVAVSVTASSGIIPETDGVYEFVIYGPDASGNYEIFDDTNSKYLYAASSSDNHLKMQTPNNANGKWSIAIGNTGIATIKAQGTNKRNWMRFNSTLFSCYASGQSDIYLYIKDGEATPTESVTVTAAGYATYASDNALDFSGSSINAYIAEADGTTGVTFTKVTKVPANTGVLLYKDGGATESIPSLTGAASDVTGNVFLRGTGAAVASAVGDLHNYILNKPSEKPIGFYKAAGQTVAKNRAYIQIDESTPVKGFITLPGDDATAIESLTPNPSPVSEGSIFNLAGQRMSKLQKGVNIVNGKKVLVK